MKNIKHNQMVNEYLYINEMPTGLTCYVVPKKGFVEKQGMITVNYGSADNEFEMNGSPVKMPSGIAHYLEHKLFEGKEGNAYDAFSKLGSNVNAFTSFTNTAYYFNCTDNFEENLETLLNFVQEPYFTEENVEKEKGIISAEINMYKDDPNWIVYINMLSGLYHNPSFKENIAGTNASIKKITPDMLYDCYNQFYAPHNMAVVCCGDIEPESVYRIAEASIKAKRKKETRRLQPPEPAKINKKTIKENLPISTPFFYIGFKDNDNDSLIHDKTAAIKVLIDMVAGQSSRLYQELVGEGLINRYFSIEYMSNCFFSHSIFSGFSKDYEQIADMLMKEIYAIKKKGIESTHFNRIKNKYIGRYIRGFNSIDTIASGQVDYFSKGTDLFDAMESFINLDEKSVEHYLHEHLKEENMVLSLILPEKKLFSRG